MLRGTLDRMIGRADPDLRRDRAEPADLGVSDDAAAAEVGVIAELGVFDRGVAEDFAATADFDLPQLDRRLDDGFGKLGREGFGSVIRFVLDAASGGFSRTISITAR